MKIEIVLAAALLVGGCSRLGTECEKDETLFKSYIAYCRELAVEKGPIVGENWEMKGTYRMVYSDAQYLSYRIEEYDYSGGAHGRRQVRVGTFDRASGKLLLVEDWVPAARRDEYLRLLRQKVVEQLGGEDQLLGEVTLTNNCYFAADGLHFV